MSGFQFQPNMWKFKKPKPSSTALPTTNKFWVDIDTDDDNATSESKGDENNKDGKKTETQNANEDSNATTSEQSGTNVTNVATLKGKEITKPAKGKRCFVCHGSDHLRKDCASLQKALTLNQLPAKNECGLEVDKIKKCYKCDGWDHFWKVCPLAKDEQNKNVDNSSPKTEENKTGNSEVSPITAGDGSKIMGPSLGKPIEKLPIRKCLKCLKEGHPTRACFNKHKIKKLKEKKESPVADGSGCSNIYVVGSGGPAIKIEKAAIVKCYKCQEEGHNTKACPLKKRKPKGIPSPFLCLKCKTHGHKTSDCRWNPANKNKIDQKKPKNENLVPVKPVLTSIETLIKQNKCTYCGVAGHSIQTCPVKKWRINPGASEGDPDFKEEFTSFADGEKPEPPNPTLAAAGAPGKVTGNREPSPTPTQINEMIARKEKELKKKRANCAKLFAKQQQDQMAFLSNAANIPKPIQPVPVTFVNHPNAAIKIPVKQAVPQMPMAQYQPVTLAPNMANLYAYRQSFPAGIPKSFLVQQHQDQILQQNTKQPVGMNTVQPNQPIYSQEPSFSWPQAPQPMPQTSAPIDQQPTAFIPIQQDSMDSEKPQAYSPSDVYGDMKNESGSIEAHEGSESPDPQGQKRLSAFQRLGPATQKKPKLTINLSCDKGQAVREVVDETTELVEEHPPVHLRSDVTTSTDETVMKYLYFWPWKKTVPVRRTATFKNSKSAMLLEQEQMEESYDKDNAFMQISVTNYPKTWSKEDVFDVLLEQVNIIPCFIEFTSKECKFLVIRSKPALLSIHKMGFKIRKEDVELVLKISVTVLTQNQIDFMPRLILRKRLGMGYDGEHKLNLQEFTLKSDISHFVYFPLNRLPNQTELIQMQSVVDWDRLTELNLSHNRLTTIDGFHLPNTCPNLKMLDVSYNCLDKVTALLRCRYLPLHSLSLEGNPLCHDYTDPGDYVRLVRMLFPTVRILDGVTIHLKGDLPAHKKNHCLHGSETIVEKYLDTFYPLLEAQPADRQMLEDMYDENALMTVLYRYKFIHRLFRISSSNSKSVDDGVKDVLEGATAVTKYVNKWPAFKHDPFTFTVDVLLHNEQTTIVKICGILKLTAESLAEDEHIISFSRTTVLHTSDGVEYKILNEMLLWDEPSNECHAGAFQITKIRSKKLYVDLEFESKPDEETKEKLVLIFEHLTELDRHSSRKCLERKDWNLKHALDNFIQLLKLNDLSSISSSSGDVRPPPLTNQHGRERQLVSLTQ